MYSMNVTVSMLWLGRFSVLFRDIEHCIQCCGVFFVYASFCDFRHIVFLKEDISKGLKSQYTLIVK